MQIMMYRKGEYPFIIVLGLALMISFTNAQCPSITINDLGNTTVFSSNGLVSVGIVPPGEAFTGIPVRIRNFAIVCDASGNRINTSSGVSVVVEFQCDFDSATTNLAVCSDPNNIVTRQYQFQCIERNGQPVWVASVSGSTLFVQTISPTATLSTPLVNQCRRCIDDEQSSRANPTTHCDPCPAQCDQGQRRCYIGQAGDVCCNFYLQGNCVADCPSALVANSNFNCVCPILTLVDGSVSYSIQNRDIGSLATHTCNSGYRLLPQGGETRTCTSNGWTGQTVTCEQIVCPDLTIANGIVSTNPPGRLLNSRTVYTCNPGFALKGDGNRICQEDSTWSGTDPECEQIVCPDLTIENGVVGSSPPGRLLNSLTVYDCNEGFALVGDGNRICRENSTWNGTDPKCADCSPTLQDSNCEECGYDLNNRPICTTCREGYKVVGGQCKNEVCPALTLPGGAVSYSMNSNVVGDVGSVATHTCDPGFRLIPQGLGNTRTCSTSGWNNPVFMCELISGVSNHYLNGILLVITLMALYAILE